MFCMRFRMEQYRERLVGDGLVRIKPICKANFKAKQKHQRLQAGVSVLIVPDARASTCTMRIHVHSCASMCINEVSALATLKKSSRGAGQSQCVRLELCHIHCVTFFEQRHSKQARNGVDIYYSRFFTPFQIGEANTLSSAL